ncbi:TniQ family protein (plasmid) [Xanthobacter dioxanivorans]|uniref:TniQ family protein n=1 Tax=Xanthobacter dioxanivorans TaxID=2528964 RepID=A0A974PUC4_9HYPH|nr:TniQ family protein [Xanthobacter dioxanivorans]QRG09958.1 TniQ family protein [Xanthobacter dioxanivorans]
MSRLPVAPRPFRDELLSSWLARVACRYGLSAEELAGHFNAGQTPSLPLPIDDCAPAADRTGEWAAACGVDPDRLRRLSLNQRYPRRPRPWYASQGPEWAPSLGSPPVCAACFDDDHAAGRDAYLRAHWQLAELCVCPRHGRLFHDRCTCCHQPLSLGFRMRAGYARPVCNHCEGALTERGGEGGRSPDSALVGVALVLQERITVGVDRDDHDRERYERAFATLWAPLDDPAAARPALALWLGAAGWRCPYDASHAVGAEAPLGRLPIRWRFITLLALDDVFGIEPRKDGTLSELAARLSRRAAPRHRQIPSRSPPIQAQQRSSAEYERLARQILAHPAWIAAEVLPRRKQERLRARLIDAALSVEAAL